MEEDIRKQGPLYLQQQRFGKRWKRVWCVLYKESSCSISRLEFFECKDGSSVEKNERNLRKQQEHKKVIRLSDCIRVTEVDMDGCPRDTGPFLVETTEKIFMFAADREQLDDWTQKLCEIAFPMSWLEPSHKRGSLQRGQQVEQEGMEDNELYSGRETVRTLAREFRVSVRRTEASDRCRLKGDGVLRPDEEALHLVDCRSGNVLLSWPYRFLRRFGRDKSSFSFEAGRRCESGEGSFEFDTKQGNLLFLAVEAAINRQRISLPPNRQASAGSLANPDTPQEVVAPPLPSTPPINQTRTLTLPLPLPQPQPRSHGPQSTAAAQASDRLYSMVTEPQKGHHKDRDGHSPTHQHQHRPPLSRLEPPVDKTLTAVRSLTLDTRGLPIPRKNQVKMISSCPLPQAEPEPGPEPGPGPGPLPGSSPKPSSNLNQDQMYSQITLPPDRGTRKEKKGGGGMAPPYNPPPHPQEPEYSLPFDNIAASVMAEILKSGFAASADPAADPVYDSIDEMQIRNVFGSIAGGSTRTKAEHIYDEPEGCSMATRSPPCLYDDPEEVRGDAWKVMATTTDPKGQEFPYNPRVDDYAVPKRHNRAATVTVDEEEDSQEEEPKDSPYDNLASEDDVRFRSIRADR